MQTAIAHNLYRYGNPLIVALILWLTLALAAGAQGNSATSLGFHAGGDAVTNDQAFVTVSNTGDMSNERALTGSSTITVTDGGANGAITLTVNGALIPTAGGTGTATTTTGDLLVGSAGNTWSKLGIGTAGYILRVNGSGTALEWASPSSGGTVTDFSAGDLSPLFTTSESTTTTTPALTFSLSTAAANTAFGNFTGSTAAPAFTTAATVRSSLGCAASGANTDITSLTLSTPLAIASGGTNNASLGVSAVGIINGDGTKLVQTAGSALQSWRVNAGGTAVEAYTPSYTTGTVTSASTGDLSPLFTASVATATTTPALSFTLSNAAAYTVFGNNTSGSAAPAYQTMVTAQLPAQAQTYGGFGGTTSFRALPTSGSISGTYYHIGNWTSTGTLTAAAGTRIYITGTFTLDHAVTVSTGGPTPKTAAAGMIFGASGGGPGAGVSGFSGGSSGAGFGGFGGDGSYDGSHFVNGGGTYSIDDHFGGSCGGQGSAANVADTGGIGGGAGGGFGVFATGAISINADITATGGAGGNGSGASSTGCGGSGGSGGAVDLQSLSTCTIQSTRTVSVAGGAAGTSQASAYNSGGGAGGRVRMRGTTSTNSGTITLTGGAAGTGGTGTATAGASGASDIVSEVYARHN